MTATALHRLLCPSCRDGFSWPRSLLTHWPVVTGQYLREQAAIAEHRSSRRAVRELAKRGLVGCE